MRRLSRLQKPIDNLRPRLLLAQPASLLCSTCGRPSTFSTSTPRCADKEKLPYSEKLRRRIWGTDNPPGAPDPYRGSFVDARVKKQNEKYAKQHSKQEKVGEQEPEVEVRIKNMGDKPENAAFDTYEPATTWRGLEVVGEVPEYKYVFEGFVTGAKSVSKEEATIALRRAVVETIVLIEAGSPLSNIGSAGIQEDLTREIGISLVDGKPLLQFVEGGITREDITQHLTDFPGGVVVEDETAVKTDPTESEEDVAADRSTTDPLHPEEAENTIENIPTESEEDIDADKSPVDPLHRASGLESQEAAALVASWDPSWKDIPLAAPDVKFAIIKRTMQLTGIHIPDPSLNTITNIPSLLEALIQRPRPRKLAQELAEKVQRLEVDLPNVKVLPRKITEIHKETQVGRWKVIKAELKSKGLPVYPDRRGFKWGEKQGQSEKESSL